METMLKHKNSLKYSVRHCGLAPRVVNYGFQVNEHKIINDVFRVN